MAINPNLLTGQLKSDGLARTGEVIRDEKPLPIHHSGAVVRHHTAKMPRIPKAKAKG
ncbi:MULTISPECIES: hypothetical protein [unclassified Fibrobacter]|uniref:hypothetical protein n=1 Tax=unclassified Fibrobacter TaxID=2634177 RepID=UPI001564D66C|nr:MULTISPECIES: hypothetical protein [unclassified Fibrobacter]